MLETETGIGGILFGVIGIPGVVLMVIGAGMWMIDRRLGERTSATGTSPTNSSGRRLFIIGALMFGVTGVLAAISAWVL